jgi:hypothetical protein
MDKIKIRLATDFYVAPTGFSAHPSHRIRVGGPAQPRSGMSGEPGSINKKHHNISDVSW